MQIMVGIQSQEVTKIFVQDKLTVPYFSMDL